MSTNRDDDDESDDLSEATQEEFEFIESQWENSVEVGLKIQWPSISQPSKHRALHLSTKLEEDAIAPLFDGTQWAGTRVWKAAVVALEYLLEHHDDPSTTGSDGTSTTANSLLELGCGLGVPAMLWHLIHEIPRDDAVERGNHSPPRVVLSDMPDLLPQLEANLKNNFGDYLGKSIDAKALAWSKEGIRECIQSGEEPEGFFDICLNCDCIYEPLYGRDSWEALADLLGELARLSPRTLLVTSVERRVADGLENFVERLEAIGTVHPLRKVLRNDEDPHHIIEIYVTKGITEPFP
eukprot:Nitzschia sp. Nitz4//scaffold108_size72880//14748//15632//NITZ4_005808-RA/size72880-processed-gene-0.47-mRNA-1//-1//CDS//3329532648//7415//frame0